MTDHRSADLIAERYRIRPATLDDIPAVADLVNRCVMLEEGAAPADPDDMRGSWQRPGMNPATDMLIVEDTAAGADDGAGPDGGSAIVGFAGVSDRPPHVDPWAWGRVDPDHMGRGLGTVLLKRTEARARQSIAKAPSDARVVIRREVYKTNEAARALLARHDYDVTRHYWRMARDLDGDIPAPQWAEGISVRTFDRARDFERLFYADKEAFADHYGVVEMPDDEAKTHWQHWMDTDPHHDPALWFLAMDGDEVAGFSLCAGQTNEDPEMGYVAALGVRRDWRRRGIGLALLFHSFRVLQAQGRARVSLHVDAQSLTGATRLYERAGMHADREYTEYSKELRPGVELRTQTLDD